MYEKIRKWYKQGLWTEEMVLYAAQKDLITPEQATEILKQEEI